MSAKKVIFRMENCGHLPAEVCGVLGRFVHKSTQAGNFSVRTSAIFPYAGPQTGPRKSADINADIFADVYVDVRMDWCRRPHGLVRTSAWMGVDVWGSPHGWVRTSAGPEDLLELLPLLCNNLLIICGMT